MLDFEISFRVLDALKLVTQVGFPSFEKIAYWGGLEKAAVARWAIIGPA